MNPSSSPLSSTAVSSYLLPSGLHQLVLPEGFELGEAPGFALFRRDPGARHPRRLAPYAFWLASRPVSPDHRELVLAFLTGPRARVGLRTLTLDAELLYHPRRLAHVLEHEGLRLDPGASTHAAHYLRSLLERVPSSPVQTTPGWNAKQDRFQLGLVGVGHRGRLAPTYPACLPLVSSLRRTGQPSAWAAAADAVIDLSPAAAVALAAALVAPLARPMGWRPLHVALHGDGAASVLEATASVFGSAALMTRAGPRGDLVAPFWSLDDLPHLLDATEVDRLPVARRRLVARALQELSTGHSLRVIGGVARSRPLLGPALIALPAIRPEAIFTDPLAKQYLPLPASERLPAGLLAELGRHHGHLGYRLVQEMVKDHKRDPRLWRDLRDYPSRMEHDLVIPASLPEPYASYRQALLTALSVISIADSFVGASGRRGEPMPDYERWRAQIQRAWEQILLARPLSPLAT